MSARSSILYTFEGCYFFPSHSLFIFIENPIRSRNDDDKITTVINNDLYIIICTTYNIYTLPILYYIIIKLIYCSLFVQVSKYYFR